MKINLSVTDFAVPVPKKGSIDVFSGYGRATQLGIEIHQQVQAQRLVDFKNYQAEVAVSHTFEKGPFSFEVGGRMDGFFEESVCKIEEIKSGFNVFELFKILKANQDDHPYCLQLKVYGYIHYLKKGSLPQLNLHLVSTRNGETKDLMLHLDVPSFEPWLEKRLSELCTEAELSLKRIEKRKKTAQKLTFPFAEPRKSQTELMALVEKGMAERQTMLIQAPTGLGKTLGVLHPSLKQALGRGQRVIYVTPKNSQHTVAEDAIERLQDCGAPLRSLTITAKSKICMKNEPLCNPEYCEYAKDHYTKVSENDLIHKLSKKKILRAKTFEKMATEFEVCPFELQLDAAKTVDTVICDYNYVFAPRSAFGRLTDNNLVEEGKPNLVIDEAHNLPSRSMDYYSPALSVSTLQKIREDLEGLDSKFKKQAQKFVDECIQIIQACAPKGADKPSEIKPPLSEFLYQDEALRQFLSTYLKSDLEIQAGDPILRLCFYWSEFASSLEFLRQGKEPFFTTYHPNPATIKITCCDASEMLKDTYKDFDQVVGFSATLKPFDYYSKLSGLSSETLKTAEFSSPFPKENRKLLVIPQLSSKYSERQRHYPRIAETMSRIMELKPGNYFAFFPSFDFMQNVLKNFQAPYTSEIIKQERFMRTTHVENILEQLRTPGVHHTVFAVQGGILSEGVDYPGDMAIGAFVIGPALPLFDLEREKMRQYYDTKFEAGFDYAYTYPAMAKAVQAAGRVIRSEKDKGLIVLMDNRFILPSFAKSMPQDWFAETPHELVSGQILYDVKDFWSR